MRAGRRATARSATAIQTNGRCESANPHGDTYGPVAYEAYLPGYWRFGWTGKWDDLPAAHFTSIVFDLLCLLGLALVGLRFGGTRLAVTLAFAWAAYPFTQYVSSSNTNDALPPLFLIWGFWLVSSPVARGAFAALAGWTKFAPLLLAPLWASYPGAPAAADAASSSPAFVARDARRLLDPAARADPLGARARVFWDRTISLAARPRLAVLALGLAAVPRRACPTCTSLQRVLEGAAARRRGRRRTSSRAGSRRSSSPR